VAQILFLGRFLCFMALFYLALHKIVSRFSRKPNSKLLWFFSVVTAPLTRPIRVWMMPGAADDQVLSRSLLVYALLWLGLVALGRIL
jgi:uncharacterized protein YggT (Ycf19 family)